ncbi:entry exclusion protein TrbK [Nitratireductor rhodophyticola]
MTRTTIIVAAATVTVGIAVAIWFVPNSGEEPDRAHRFLDTPSEHDTTGGQEMRPRWGNGEGQGDEAPEN